MFDWATVGNPGNAPDQLSTVNNPTDLRFGAVDYAFRISKYEVTNAQYAEFLNAVDATGANPDLGGDDGYLYLFLMSDETVGGINFDAEAANGSKYSTKPNMGNKPVNYVSFYDAMRFVNWLENGQPTDGTGTETGVYAIGDGFSETRAPGAKFFIPSEDEWYKAAYHQPAAQGGDADDYWRYATRSNSAPTLATANVVGDIDNPGASVANYGNGANWNGQLWGNVTTVGSAGPMSASFYGTFDQDGNVAEWNESTLDMYTRGLRGGSYIEPDTFLPASMRVALGELYLGFENWGFRVASAAVPEPSSISLISLMTVGGLVVSGRRTAVRRAD